MLNSLLFHISRHSIYDWWSNGFNISFFNANDNFYVVMNIVKNLSRRTKLTFQLVALNLKRITIKRWPCIALTRTKFKIKLKKAGQLHGIQCFFESLIFKTVNILGLMSVFCF